MRQQAIRCRRIRHRATRSLDERKWTSKFDLPDSHSERHSERHSFYHIFYIFTHFPDSSCNQMSMPWAYAIQSDGVLEGSSNHAFHWTWEHCSIVWGSSWHRFVDACHWIGTSSLVARMPQRFWAPCELSDCANALRICSTNLQWNDVSRKQASDS